MRRSLWLLILVTLHSSAEELTLTKQEDGLIHTKQKGRYEVYKKLPEKASDFDTAFDYAKPFATFRVANVATEQDGLPSYGIANEERYGTSFGGIFGFDTASLYGLHLRLGAYVSQKIAVLNPQTDIHQNSELFNADGGSYIYMGETSLVYENSFMQLQGGRIRLETPFVNSDDIRMSPNSFEGASTYVDINDEIHSELYFLTRWAGTDSGDDVDTFKVLVSEGYGLSGGSLTYTFTPENEISFWYYNVDKESDILYVEAAGDVGVNDFFHIEWGLQGAYITERDNSNIEGQVLGAMIIADLSYLYVGLSYNYAFEKDNKTITDGFGGGPYYTSLDEQTLGAVSSLAPGDDLGVYRLALGTNIHIIGKQNLNIEVVHGHFYLEQSSAEAVETDLMVSYKMSARWQLESTYTHVDLIGIDYSVPSKREIRDFQRLITRLDYKF